MKIYLYVIAFLLMSGIGLGVIIPLLISASDDILVFTGIILIALFPLSVYLFAKFIVKNIKEKNNA